MTSKYLVVTETGIKVRQDSLVSSVRHFPFSAIECVVMAPNNTLSFQVGEEVFSIETRADKPKHQATIAALLEGLQRAEAERTIPQGLPQTAESSSAVTS